MECCVRSWRLEPQSQTVSPWVSRKNREDHRAKESSSTSSNQEQDTKTSGVNPSYRTASGIEIQVRCRGESEVFLEGLERVDLWVIQHTFIYWDSLTSFFSLFPCRHSHQGFRSNIRRGKRLWIGISHRSPFFTYTSPIKSQSVNITCVIFVVSGPDSPQSLPSFPRLTPIVCAHSTGRRAVGVERRSFGATHRLRKTGRSDRITRPRILFSLVGERSHDGHIRSSARCIGSDAKRVGRG